MQCDERDFSQPTIDFPESRFPSRVDRGRNLSDDRARRAVVDVDVEGGSGKDVVARPGAPTKPAVSGVNSGDNCGVKGPLDGAVELASTSLSVFPLSRRKNREEEREQEKKPKAHALSREREPRVPPLS